jgi:putative redox protein
MASDTVHLNWNPEEQFVLSDKDNYQIKMKKPNGVKPSDLMAMALIGCSSHDVVEILQKQRQDLQQLNVTAESTQDNDPPWRFRRIHIHYQAVGKGIDLGEAPQGDPDQRREVLLSLRHAEGCHRDHTRF